MAKGKGKAQGTAISKGTGAAASNAMAAGGGDADSNAHASGGGSSSSNAVAMKGGSAKSNSVALLGGSSKSSATAKGGGAAKSNSMAKGGGNAQSLANAQGGGEALSNALTAGGGNAHSIANADGGGNAMANSMTSGGGTAQSDAIATGAGDATANAIAGGDDAMSPDDIQKMMADAMGASLFSGSGRSISSESVAHYVPGWKTQGGEVSPGSTLALDRNGFFGLGPCPPVPVSHADLQKASSDDEIISFYMKLTRTQCLDKEKSFIKNLMKNGIIKIDSAAKVFNVNSKNPLITQKKITNFQADELYFGFEICVFSNKYQRDGGKVLNNRSHGPNNANISPTVRFIVDMILHSLQKAHENVPAHLLRMVRNLLSVVKAIYTKLLQDFDVLEGCQECNADADVNISDRTEVMALIEYIIKGLSPYAKSGATMSITEDFEKFFANNNEAIKIRVSTFSA